MNFVLNGTGVFVDEYSFRIGACALHYRFGCSLGSACGMKRPLRVAEEQIDDRRRKLYRGANPSRQYSTGRASSFSEM
jgi:hypothetical protein